MQRKSRNSEQNDSANWEDDEGIDSNITDEVINNEKQERPGSESEGGKDVSSDEVEGILGSNISEKWLHMDQVEPEKLEWMKNCEMPSAKKSGVCFKTPNSV